MKRVLIIGYGSIGERHARVLKELGAEVGLVTSRSLEACEPVFRTVEEGVLKHGPQYCLVTNETSKHNGTMQTLASVGFRGVLFVEKPIFKEPTTHWDVPFKSVVVGYHLRMHPVVRRIADLIGNEVVFSVQCYVGQYLPDWRPGRDYREQYSAKQKGGGGVLRDLSHELDLMMHLLGRWKRATAIIGRFGDLKIESEDTACILAEFERCPAATIQMNYLHRGKRREIIVNAAGRTICGDLIQGTVVESRTDKPLREQEVDAYRLCHEKIMAGDYQHLATLEEGLDVVHFISALEQSSREGQWTEN